MLLPRHPSVKRPAFEYPKIFFETIWGRLGNAMNFRDGRGVRV